MRCQVQDAMRSDEWKAHINFHEAYSIYLKQLYASKQKQEAL
jgi:hypothetical protein